MTLPIFLRATLYSALVSGILVTLAHVAYGGGNVNPGTISATMALGAVLAVYTALTVEFFFALFNQKRPSLGIVFLMLSGLVVYVGVSKLLGAPLFSNSIKDGIVGCIFFTGFSGCALYLAARESSLQGFYLFGGMVAGFMYNPLIACVGVVTEPSLNQALGGSLVGAVLAVIQLFFCNHEFKKVINKGITS